MSLHKKLPEAESLLCHFIFRENLKKEGNLSVLKDFSGRRGNEQYFLSHELLPLRHHAVHDNTS
jgi:hypothetical protein